MNLRTTPLLGKGKGKFHNRLRSMNTYILSPGSKERPITDLNESRGYPVEIQVLSREVLCRLTKNFRLLSLFIFTSRFEGLVELSREEPFLEDFFEF